ACGRFRLSRATLFGHATAAMRLLLPLCGLLSCFALACGARGPLDDGGDDGDAAPSFSSAAGEVRTRCILPGAGDDWRWRKLGPVRGLPDDAARGDGLLAPSAVMRDGVLHLWFLRKSGLRQVLHHATS